MKVSNLLSHDLHQQISDLEELFAHVLILIVINLFLFLEFLCYLIKFVFKYSETADLPLFGAVILSH